MIEECKSDKALCDEGSLAGGADSLWSLVAGLFKGPLGWTAVFVFVESIIGLVLMIFVAFKFFDAEGSRDQIMLATIFLGLMMIMLLAKIWSWMLMFRNSAIKRVDRLECRIAALTKMISEK